MNELKLKCVGAVFSESWEDVSKLLQSRMEELKEQAIVENDDRQRLVMKGKFQAFQELYILRTELEGIKHIT